MAAEQHVFDVGSVEETRLDKYLAGKLPSLSRSKIQRLIKNGQVRLNDRVVSKTGEQIASGDRIEIYIPQKRETGLIPEMIPLDIVYEDTSVIVVNKPSGIVVHPGAGNPTGTLVNALLAYDPAIRSIGDPDRPGVVHRLDKETSGVLIFARTDKAYRWLVKQFKTRDIEKKYLALVDGRPPTPTGRIEAPIIRDPVNRTQMAVGLRGQGKPAVSEYFVIQSYQRHTYLEVHPITGRTHQIRVHLAYLDIPVVADTVYGFRNPTIDLGERFFLHAKSLSLRLPGDRAKRTFEAPLPSDLQTSLRQLQQQERSLE
jgi:23S rRNA pseudouridine1911/1915/1917 synthase